MAPKNGTFHYDEKFFQDVLRKDSQDSSIRVLGIDFKLATSKGDNYMSDIYRVLVNYSKLSKDGEEVNETRSLIIKCELVSSQTSKELVENYNVFLTELKVLQEIVPRIRRSLGTQLGPHVLYGVENTPQAIVMEDLTARGFLVKDRIQGLSLDHVTMAIQNVARFHAGSVAICEEPFSNTRHCRPGYSFVGNRLACVDINAARFFSSTGSTSLITGGKNPEMVKQFNKGVFSNAPEGMYRMMESSLIELSIAVRTWSDSKCERLSSKIEALSGTIREKLRYVYDCDPDEFCVLNHGDCWINNMLFKENDKGEPCEHMFVDFQVVMYTSPAGDLQYLLYLNPSLDIKCDADDILLERYLDTLTSSMKALGCKTDPPTLEALKKAMLKRRIVALMAGLIFYPMMHLDKTKVLSLDKMFDGAPLHVDLYKIPVVIQTMQKVIPVFEERGYFD